VELANYNIKLVYKPGNTNKANELSRRPDMAPEDEDELVIVLVAIMALDSHGLSFSFI